MNERNTLIFQNVPTVTIATNKFINVPVILKYENTNLIEIVKTESLSYTTKIPIYYSDGTELAVANGNRLWLTEQGKKIGLKMNEYANLWVCKLGNNTLFEIRQQSGEAFKTTAEIYTPDGKFIKCVDEGTSFYKTYGNEFKIGGVTLTNCTFKNCSVGILLKKNGSISIGNNGKQIL